MDALEIYTDGSCLGNPGPGGWGVVILAGDGEGATANEELSGGEAATTNNRMELTAAIKAIEAARRHRRPLLLHTDSQYVQQGITSWIRRWEKNGWRTAQKKPVKNDDLWRRLAALTAESKVEWRWVKAHAGNRWNERADRLAVEAAEAAKGE